MVLVQHAPVNLIWWGGPLYSTLHRVSGGWTGVDLFFGVSGFVIGRGLIPVLERSSVESAAVPVLRFWCRRAWRLLPSALLWLALPLLPALLFNRSGAFHAFSADVSTALAGAFDLANFHLARQFGRADTGLGFPYWSLSLEEQFYILLPLALLLLRRRLPIVLALLLLTTLQQQTPLSMMTRPAALATGVLLAFAERDGSVAWRLAAPASLSQRPVLRALLLFGAIGLLLALGSDGLAFVSFRLLPITLLAGALVFLAAQDCGMLWADGMSRRVAVWLGSRSYALYLVHIPAYAAAHEIWFRLHPTDPPGPPAGATLAIFLAATGCSCLLLADLNYRVIERPLRQHGRRIAARIGAPGSARSVAAAQ